TTGVDLGDIAFGDLSAIDMVIRVDALPAPGSPALFPTQAFWEYDYRTCTSTPPVTGVVTSDAVDYTMARLEVMLTATPVGMGMVEYRAAVSNTGTADADGATLAVNIPNGATYVANSTTMNGTAVADSGGNSPFVGGREIQAPGAGAGIIPPNTTAVVVWRVSLAGGGGSISTTVTADPDGNGPAPGVDASLNTNVGDCGDGMVSDVEQCDDGNLMAGDGCNTSCDVEDGYACIGEPSECGIDT